MQENHTKNRVYKFRAWNGNNMLYWEDIKKYGIQIFDIFDISFYKNGNRLMQYTGLKDNNGKEIYEGDIVKWGKIIEKVEMKDGCWSMDGWILGTIVEEFNLEVIGNIYENPELIKGRKVRRTCTKMY